MADTHINAYYQDVTDAQLAYDQAAANLQSAKDSLATKEKELGIVHTDPTPEPTKEEFTSKKNR